MKPFYVILLSIALVTGVYGYWGVFTDSGRSAYDEMDGMIPFFFLSFSASLVLLVMMIYLFRKVKKN
jgi:hypothetical protein